MIRVVSGVCDTELGLKRAADAPFTLSPEAEKRLVDRKVAKYVYEPVATAEASPNGADACVTVAETDRVATGLGIASNEDCHYLDKGQLEGRTFAKLKSLAKDMDIPCAKLHSKADYIDAIARGPVELGEQVFPEDMPEDIVV